MPVNVNDVTILVTIFVIFFLALVIFRSLTYRSLPQKKPLKNTNNEIPRSDIKMEIKDNPMKSKEVTFEFSQELLERQNYEKFTKLEPPIPWGYNEVKITAMYRDPNWIYTYWELTDQVKNSINSQFGPGSWENSRPILRVYNVTGINFNGENPINSFDVGINYYANNHYLEVSAPGQSFCIDLARILPNGTFYCIARSNYVTLPRDSISDVIDQNWPPLEQLYEENFGFGDFTSPRSGLESSKK